MFVVNCCELYQSALSPADQDALGVGAAADVRGMLELCPIHQPTPLRRLPDLARRMDVGEILIKDESMRLGLGSFKALGGAYAVIKLVLETASRELGRIVWPRELQSDAVRRAASKIAVACATDGNHGRSVAAGARLAGCKAVIFVPPDVSVRRLDAIRSFGASVIRVAGAYDDAVDLARNVCAEQGWLLISDTACAGQEDLPLMVMQGYSAMVSEAIAETGQTPTHVFVQAGVGGLAGAVAAHLVDAFGRDRPRIIVVQPLRAACYIDSYHAGKPVRIARNQPTVMAMLDCQEPSAVGWRILIRSADAFMTVDEEDAVEAMNILARPGGDDPAITSGESGAVGLAGLVLTCRDPLARTEMGLGPDSRILLFNSEGATDPEQYEKLTGTAA